MSVTVGVVVPAYRETESLAALLTSLDAVEHDGEVIVVVAVDGAWPETVEIARRHGALVIPLQENRGSYAARNAALDALPAGVDAVLFTDADCLVTPEWATRHLVALQDAELSGGGVQFTFRKHRPSPAEWVDACRHLQQEAYVTRDGYAATCNLAVRADVVAKHRFDASLRTGGDAEFCRRVVAETGARLVYTPDAAVLHPARDLRELLVKVDRLVKGIPHQRDRWSGRMGPSRRLTRGIWRRALKAGHRVSPLWGLTACVLDWMLTMRVARAVDAVKRDLGRSVTYVLTKHVQPSQTFVTGEIEELRRRGVRVQVIAMEHGQVLDPDTLYVPDIGRNGLRRAHARYALLRPRGYCAYLVDVLRMRGEMGWGAEQVPWTVLPLVADQVRAHGSGSLHAHFAWSGAAGARLLSLLTGRPWSVTLHAKDIFSKRRHLAHKLRTADRLVTVCEYNLAFLRRELAVSRKVDVVICGVTIPDCWQCEGSADVVTVGRLVEKKGVDVLVRAAAELRRSQPGLRIDVIGDGPERPRLEALVQELGLQGCVRLLGGLPHEESLARIAGARVFCLSARIAADGDRDSMPVVIKEAMVRNVPVVGTDIVGIPEMLADGCGLLVPPDDPAALAAALQRLLQDDSLRRELATAARARACERFSMSTEVAKLERVLLP